MHIPMTSRVFRLATAALAATATAALAQVPPLARPLPLSSVRLTDGPLQRAQALDARYLLTLEPDRMLALFRVRAGLQPKGEPYGGWDGDGRNLTGHIAGHYLSAVSLMVAATGDPRFRERARYIVDELAAVQAAHGDGYLCALEGGRRAFGELARGSVRSAAFDLNGEWAPWYTLHKLFAGLRDAYGHAHIERALDVEAALAAWAERTLSGLDEASVQRMLGTEFGGMPEVLVDLAADTGDHRWLQLADRFEHRAFLLPLWRHVDALAGKHGNTQVPKLVGAIDRFALTGRPADLVAASFFWDTVVQHHTFATGGHGQDEYFGPPDRLARHLDGRTAESCNVYNMLKLTRSLFAFRPDPVYADFMERALFNHVLGSIDPDDGRTCYMVPVGRGVQREYQDMQRDFTCCVGTGMENHALHGEGIYYEDGERLWVNLFVPSTASWDARGIRLTMATTFPEGDTATLTVAVDEPVELALLVRRPYWVDSGFAITVAGERVDASVADATERRPGRWQYDDRDPASRYVELRRVWRDGDVVEIALPKTLRLEPTPDDPQRAAILWGPLVLAGDLGAEVRPGEPATPPPVLVAAERPVAEWLERLPGDPARFRTGAGIARTPAVGAASTVAELAPFYRLHGRRYAGYWDVDTDAQWTARLGELTAAAERQRRIDAATVARVDFGDDDSLRRCGYREGPGSEREWIDGRRGRRSTSWFEVALPVDASVPLGLVLTHHGGDRRGTPSSYTVLVDGTPIAERLVRLLDDPRFHDLAIPLPGELVTGRERVTIRLAAAPDSRIATVFELRVVRADAVDARRRGERSGCRRRVVARRSHRSGAGIEPVGAMESRGHPPASGSSMRMR
ncbi:MAG: glycoside hydrolase family 127 protein [Planctomycetes bacterium]|nr:glycoside hydrolase family 127 protein [Planctomycetota bacterium]